MRGNEFLDKMALADPAYIEDAEAPGARRAVFWRRLAAVAACLALLLCGGAVLLREEAPLPELPAPVMDTGGMGYEGYLAYDAAELVSANPWREDMALRTLPVYRNRLVWSEEMRVENPDFDAMRALLLETAGGLGLSGDTLTIRDNAPGEDYRRAVTEKFAMMGDTVPEGYFAPTGLIGEAEGVRIDVDADMTARVEFSPALTPPAPLHFSHDATQEELQAVADWIAEAFPGLLHFKEPVADIHGGDYNIYGQRRLSLAFFEGAGSDADRIVQYHFGRVTFACNDDGDLFLIRVERPDLSEKAGDYPVITPDEALAQLAAGNCLTSVPYDMPGTEYVRKTELVYRTDTHEKIFMPYYRFYVELPEAAQENGLKNYGAWYVPAIKPEFFNNSQKQ